MWTSQSVLYRQKACPVARTDRKSSLRAFTGWFRAPVPEQQQCHVPDIFPRARSRALRASGRARQRLLSGERGAPLLMTAEQQHRVSVTAQRLSDAPLTTMETRRNKSS
ncbi:unnamed protein product [Coccothraustes coccothraustes]